MIGASLCGLVLARSRRREIALAVIVPRLVELREGADIYWTVEMAAMKERGEVSDDFTQEDMFGFDLVD